MKKTSGQNVFLADLHHPGGASGEIEQLLAEIPGNTRRIFLLGDIFQFWVDDSAFMEEKYASFLARLKAWAEEGIQLFFLEGNRDFLASHYFDNEPWIDVLANPTVIDLGGRAVYIGHGDELCWNDWAYQTYKTFIRSRLARLLAGWLPRRLHRRIAQRMEKASGVLVAGKKESVLAVPHRAYESVISSGIDVIVHGHVHQTYQREYTVNGRTGQVLAFGWKDGKRNLIHFEG